MHPLFSQSNRRRRRASTSSPSGSAISWIGRFKAGDDAAAQALWQGYYARLKALARRRLRGVPRAVWDEEDVVLSAFDKVEGYTNEEIANQLEVSLPPVERK
jgi:DNA-directed RNA polymerase specialized sigma24 family protein